MNQTIKEVVYKKGTTKQIDFIAKIGGMNEEETNVFKLIHEGRSDEYIIDVLGLTRKSYKKVEDAMRIKLVIALFECINSHMSETI